MTDICVIEVNWEPGDIERFVLSPEFSKWILDNTADMPDEILDFLIKDVDFLWKAFKINTHKVNSKSQLNKSLNSWKQGNPYYFYDFIQYILSNTATDNIIFNTYDLDELFHFLIKNNYNLKKSFIGNPS